MRTNTRINQSGAMQRHCPKAWQAVLLEALEPRMLMSHSDIVTPFFTFEDLAGWARPAATTSPMGLAPAQVLGAYGIDEVQFGSVVGDGSGQTIAIVIAYDAPTIVQDLHMFSQYFDLPDANLIRVGQDGSNNLPGTDPYGPGYSWALEAALDVQWAHAVAPQADIVLVEANSPSYGDMMAAVDTARNYPGVSVVSMSWGGPEFRQQTTFDKFFTTPAGHEGVTFVAASGDSGAYKYASTKKGVSYPAASANVLAVGGTYLKVDADNNYVDETGWGYGRSSSFFGGAGGGASSRVKRPAYQKGVAKVSTSKRVVPDVALLADPRSGVPVFDSWDFPNGSWVKVGGTSLAAPLWAGVIALTNQGRELAGLSSMDGRTQTLPSIYKLPSTDFHDIIRGDNGYVAKAGYDLITGRGTPIVNLLVPHLVGAINGLTASPVKVPLKAAGALAIGNVGAAVAFSGKGSVGLDFNSLMPRSQAAALDAQKSYMQLPSFDAGEADAKHAVPLPAIAMLQVAHGDAEDQGDEVSQGEVDLLQGVAAVPVVLKVDGIFSDAQTRAMAGLDNMEVNALERLAPGLHAA